jgi:hypothetical protein
MLVHASAGAGHAAWLTDGQVSHEADRLAAMRARRAAAARDLRSAGHRIDGAKDMMKRLASFVR